MYDYDYIPSRILDSAKKYSSKAAYRYGNGSITYEELKNGASAIAHYLSEDSSPVIIYGHKSPLFITTILGCLMCGRTYIPCDFAYPAERVARIADAATAKLVLHTETEGSDNVDGVQNIRAEALGAAVNERKDFVCRKNGDERAYIVFTSGSTGVPKGIEITRSELANFIDYALSVPALSNPGEWAGHALFSFDLSVVDIYLPLFKGDTFRAVEPLETGAFRVLCCTPSFLRLCLCSATFCRENLPKLDTVICCGEVLPVKTAKLLKDRFDGIHIINAYGPAECCCFVICHEVTEDDLEKKTLPVGDVAKGSCRVSIRNGEIFIEGKSVGAYVDGHAGGFKDGGYYTGDSGEIENGMLYFGGRINRSMIKYSGYRIEPGEIEAEISAIDEVEACVCVPIYSSDGSVVAIKAHVTGENADVAAIKSELSKKLPSYMIPKIIEVCEQLLMTPNGKCDREGLEKYDNR